MKRLWPAWLIAAALVVALFAAFYFLRAHPAGERAGVLDKTAWQRMASPGALSSAHSFLEHDCSACHTPLSGVQAANCIVCHADDDSLLGRQPTVFHATIGSCRECHIEHRGPNQRPTQMDHTALTHIALRQLPPQLPAEGDPESSLFQSWITNGPRDDQVRSGLPALTLHEALLDCAACHANEDPHRQFFGRECAQCHGTANWQIPAFRHPSPRSRDCAQCHQGPPSHYMGHFHMISARVAGKPHAQVSQCYLCHQTTSWNDIQGVGWYKHH